MLEVTNRFACGQVFGSGPGETTLWGFWPFLVSVAWRYGGA